MRTKLTQRQENFCLAYVKSGNASEAYRQSYNASAMKDTTVHRRAVDVMKAPLVVQHIAQLREKISSKTVVEQTQVLEELAVHAFYDPAELLAVKGPEDVVCLPAKIRRCIVGWSWDRHGNFILKLANKTAALELIGRHLGMFVERQEIRVGELERLDDAALNTRIAQAAEQLAQIEGVPVETLLQGIHPVAQTVH